MVPDHEPTMSEDFACFPTTHWSMLDKVRGPMTQEHRDTLNSLIQRYWKPVYAYIYCRGFKSEAADLTQDFFVFLLGRELFGRADAEIGRFRPFLRTCLNNFLKDIGRYRDRHGPPQGIVSIHELAMEDKLAFELSENETPETLFCRTWVSELLNRVWETLEQQLIGSGKRVHCELFRQRVFQPALRGTRPPPLRQLAQQAGLTEKQASNRIVTVLRAFQKLLREEIRVYASSEDEVTSEIRDLFRFAASQ